MPHANQYSPTAGFSDDANRNTPGRSGVNATALDDEFSHVSESINQIIKNQKLLQRDDGRLKDTVVEVHTLSREVLMLLGNYRLRGGWLASTEYSMGDVAINNGLMYVCAIAHVSDYLFSEQPNWRHFGFAGSADAAQAAAQAVSAAQNAAVSAATAQNAAGTSTTKAAEASASATSAQNAAGTSTTKAAEASASATSAMNSAATAQTSASTASSSAAQAVSANNAAQSAAAAAQAAAQMGGVSNERIVYGDDASKTSLVAKADLAASSGFYESSDDTPTIGKWLITTIKSKTGNERVQYAYQADDPKVQYTRGITGAVKTPWLVSWNSGNFNPNTKANLTGAKFSGGVSIANEGAPHDPYGLVAVSKPAVTDTPAYYSLSRVGACSYQIGISANDHLTFGNGTAGYNGRINEHLMMLEGGGNLWLQAYGWLHEKFASRNTNDVGCVVFAKFIINGTVAYDGPVSGGNLGVASVAAGGIITGGALPGTWKCLGVITGNGQATLFMRIA